MGLVIPQTTFEVYEPGVYQGRIVSVEPVDGQFGQQLKVKFELEGGHALTAWTSLAFSPKSKLYQMTRAAFGRDIPPDYALDVDHLVNRRLRLLVTVEERADGSSYNKVQQFLAMGQPAGRPTPAPAPAPEPPAWLDSSDEIPF